MTPRRAAELIASYLAALEVVARLRPLEQREIDGVRCLCTALVGAGVTSATSTHRPKTVTETERT